MKVWYNGGHIDMEIGQTVTVFRCSSGRSSFGEPGKLERVTAQHLVFVSESGAVIKTAKNNIHQVIGRAQKNGYHVSPKAFDSFPNIIREAARFWDEKTCTLVKK